MRVGAEISYLNRWPVTPQPNYYNQALQTVLIAMLISPPFDLK